MVWNETVPSATKKLGRILSGKTEKVLRKRCGVTDKLENDIQLRRCMMTFWKEEITTPKTNEKSEEIIPIIWQMRRWWVIMIAIWKENGNEDWGQKVLQVKETIVIQAILIRKGLPSEQEEENKWWPGKEEKMIMHKEDCTVIKHLGGEPVRNSSNQRWHILFSSSSGNQRW